MNDLVICRRQAEEEIAEIAHLSADAEAFDRHKALGDHTWLDLVHVGRRGIYGFTARRKASSQLLGYAQVSWGNDTWSLEIVVHPMARKSELGVAESLISRCVAEIGINGGGHVHVWLPHRNPDLEVSLRQAGFSPGRDLIQLRRTLPLESDLARAEIQTRPFRVGVDEDAWLEVNNRAFANHPEQGGWTRETLEARQQETWFDPPGFLLHFRGERLAGFCWTKIHADAEPPMGEIYVIGVDPAFGGQGLGHKLCVAGLNYIASRHLHVGMLYVDATNENAIAMYTHLGFHPDHMDSAFVADIAPTMA